MAKRAIKARAAPGRQRQRLIEACISALHLYGPSRTTVEKVVAIAKMSPGIVRFYFDSKAAMLVAALQFLAAEFEERVLVPVAKLKGDPVAALEELVDLYLDPDIASPRKVSVWYAFWGEASSRQEYYDICGQKDQSFAALVRELIGRLIAQSPRPAADADGIALGLIGALEILWQDFAFQDEAAIDRIAAKRRCMAYLRSVFPGRFDRRDFAGPGAPPRTQRRRIGAWAYVSERALQAERPLFRASWQMVGPAQALREPGEFLTADLGGDPVIVVRGNDGTVLALRNRCPNLPHTLVNEACGRGESWVCRAHGLAFDRDGTSRERSAVPDLDRLQCAVHGGWILVKTGQPAGTGAFGLAAWSEPSAAGVLRPLGPVIETSVAADWKIIVGRWLETMPVARADASIGFIDAAGTDTSPSHRRFVAPNHWVEWRPDGVSVMQAVPESPGRSTLRHGRLTRCPDEREAKIMSYRAERSSGYGRRALLGCAESAQRVIAKYAYPIDYDATGALAWFRDWLIERSPELAAEGAINDAWSP